MPANVLIPTDGSELSAKAAAYGVNLAKQLGARVTAVTVTTPWESMTIGEVPVVRNPDEYEKQVSAQSKTMLDVVAKLAAEAGVACEAVQARNPLPWDGILSTGKAKGCDLIVIATHGRRGLSAMLLGSETQKVLSHSAVPVLIYREAKR